MKASTFQGFAASLFKDYGSDAEALGGLLSHMRD